MDNQNSNPSDSNVAPTEPISPVPGQGLGEAVHGNVKEGDIYFGDVGVDRTIDATVSHTFSEGHHPIFNPISDTSSIPDTTYIDDTEVAEQGMATISATPTDSGPTGTAALSGREPGANEGDPRYALSPDTAIDPAQDLEAEGRTGTTTPGNFQDNTFGSGNRDQSVTDWAEGPISLTNTPGTDAALGAYGQPGGGYIEGRQLSEEQEVGSLRNHPSLIHPSGGTEDGFAYQKQDDNNPEPTEDIAGSLGMTYSETQTAAHDTLSATIDPANLNPLLAALLDVGVTSDEVTVKNDGATCTVQVAADRMNRDYVQQLLDKYNVG